MQYHYNEQQFAKSLNANVYCIDTIQTTLELRPPLPLKLANTIHWNSVYGVGENIFSGHYGNITMNRSPMYSILLPVLYGTHYHRQHCIL